MDNSKNLQVTEDSDFYYVRWFRHWKSGKLIFAKDYGKTAFKIPKRKRK